MVTTTLTGFMCQDIME